MNIMELGALGEFVGSIGVIATLIYLALQIRQNTQMPRRQAQREQSSDLTGPFIEPGSPLPAIYTKVIAVDEAMEPLTQAIMNTYGLDAGESVV